MKALRIAFLSFLFFFVLGWGLVIAEGGMKGPPEKNNACIGEREEEARPCSLPGFLLLWANDFFQKTISRVDGNRCPSYPTCAAYGGMVIRKHGPIVGILMIVDRLIHETSEGAYSPKIMKYGHPRIYDPPENNDFWFSRPAESP